jgi:hypothetical protein
MCDSFNAYFVSHLVIPLTTFHTSFAILVHAYKLAVRFSAVGSAIAGVSVFNCLIMTSEFIAQTSFTYLCSGVVNSLMS